jgi:serine protease AprX
MKAGPRSKSGGRRRKPRAPAPAGADPVASTAEKRNDMRKAFSPLTLERSVIAIPLLKQLKEDLDDLYHVIIDVNLDFPGGRGEARKAVTERLTKMASTANRLKAMAIDIDEELGQYVFARLTGHEILKLLEIDEQEAAKESRKSAERQGSSELPAGVRHANFRDFVAIYRIWEDIVVHPLLTKSLSTIKADAARAAFSAAGERIVWAVVDSGIQGDHPHFAAHKNLVFKTRMHRDFTVDPAGKESPLTDVNGHGTHVAGIIAGAAKEGDSVKLINPETDEEYERKITTLNAMIRSQSADERGRAELLNLGKIEGVAPKCKLVSLKVIPDDGPGRVSTIIKALGWVQQRNGYGRRQVIHGVNISIGYTFDPEWFACGQSPLCVEIDRLVRMGVAVVVAAGNSGYRGGKRAKRNPDDTEERSHVDIFGSGVSHSINDPGNADLAITVGSTHRDMPHTYGVSYFSSKGPTGDGRLKPDLLAPGERIVSCAYGQKKQERYAQVEGDGIEFDYLEESGTSMAAPHVSGAIAAFLSIRREFIGRPSKVKEIFLATATDLKRDRYAQGQGLVDLMRAIQSV